MERNPTIHLVDDADSVRESLTVLLECYNFAVRPYPSATELLRHSAEDIGGCLLTDFHMPDMTGIELIEQLRERGVQIPAVVISAAAPDCLPSRAGRLGAAVLAKPFRVDELLPLLGRLCRLSLEELAALDHPLGDGTSFCSTSLN